MNSVQAVTSLNKEISTQMKELQGISEGMIGSWSFLYTTPDGKKIEQTWNFSMFVTAVYTMVTLYGDHFVRNYNSVDAAGYNTGTDYIKNFILPAFKKNSLISSGN